MTKKIIAALLAVLIMISFSSCNRESNRKYTLTTIEYFDTVITISGYFSSQKEFDVVSKKLEQKIKYYHRLFDIYNNYDGLNNLKTVNDNAGVCAVKVDSEIIDFLSYCKEIYKLTDKNVNICLGPVLAIWHDYRTEGKKLPSKSELYAVKNLVSIKNLVINKKNSTAFLKKQGCSIDVGAVAKGYVCDVIKEYAASIGFENGIINLGGNVLTIGKKPDLSNFNVAVKDPNSSSKNIFNVSVSGKSVVTSGDYERFYEVNGKRYCHIISPKTLMPADNNKAVTVICENSALADALSTTLFIMDYSDGIKLAESLDDCEACIIDKNSKVHYSSDFKKYIVK